MDFSFICSMCGAVVRTALRSPPNDGREATLSLGPGHGKGTCKAWRPGRRWTEKKQRPGAAGNWKMMEMWWKCDGSENMLAFFGSFILIIRVWAWFKSGRQTELLYTAKRLLYISWAQHGATFWPILAGQQFLPCSTCNRCVCVCFPDTVAGTTHMSTFIAINHGVSSKSSPGTSMHCW